MKYYLILFTFFLLNTSLFPLDNGGNKCQNKKSEDGSYWARNDSRTQGGGWIWFPGKGASENLEHAYMQAEGMAIKRLIMECNFPHKVVKFHERCDELDDGEYYAYVRASLKQDICSQTKNATPSEKKTSINSNLMAIYIRYQKYSDEVFSEESEKRKNKNNKLNFCNADNGSKCLKYAKYEWINGNKEQAIKYGKIGCMNDDAKSCAMIGKFFRKKNDKKKAKKFFIKSCELGLKKVCEKLNMAKNQKGKGRGRGRGRGGRGRNR